MRDEQVKTGELIASLEKAIKCDRNFFVAAKADPQFQHVSANVDKLLTRLYNEAKSDAQKGLDEAQSAVKKMIDWRASETSPNDFNIANTKLREAQGSFEKKDYISYLDALSAAVEAKNKAKSATDNQKASILRTIRSLESEINLLEADIRPLLQQLNPLVKSYLPSDLIPEDRFQEALAYKKEAQQLIQVENHDNYFKAQLSLSKCKNMLEILSSYLSNARHKAQANSEYNKNIYNIESEKYNKRKMLLLAIVLISIAAIIAIISAIIFVKKVGRDEVSWLYLFLWPLLSSFFVVIADRIWSISENAPGKDFFPGCLWLLASLFNIGLSIIWIIMAIVVLFRGIIAIDSEYQKSIQLAEKQRSDYLSKYLINLT